MIQNLTPWSWKMAVMRYQVSPQKLGESNGVHPVRGRSPTSRLVVEEDKHRWAREFVPSMQ